MVLPILDKITELLLWVIDRRSAGSLILRKGLVYCWSLAVVALPQDGKTLLEKWLIHMDKDFNWLMKEKFKKNRLIQMEVEWARRWSDKIGG